MIQVNISEVKNRLSYYLRLVRGGQQIEILDRKTPLARIIHVSKAETENRETPWIKEMVGLGIVSSPAKDGFPAEFLDKEKVILPQAKGKTSALKVLLEERNTGR
ncbi:MAG: type II toxin-antitoxin system Phd/YefM family antitoxin [Deltaproteobacteria bacterium]|nr:type II toxin-antitoxin system Phd/YefM family antitoxin [Deltaproteobacteria bacterium]